MSELNKQHLEDAWKEFERTGEICNTADGLLDYATALTEHLRLKELECQQLAEDKSKLRKFLTSLQTDVSTEIAIEELLEQTK